ncbi:MAG TPA: hypothetical protein PK765_04825 [bacterium]|nr:hypothetical protein [bacterium]
MDTTNDLVALSDGSTHVRASLSSFDSDGFTLDYSQADASSVSIYLCIG